MNELRRSRSTFEHNGSRGNTGKGDSSVPGTIGKTTSAFWGMFPTNSTARPHHTKQTKPTSAKPATSAEMAESSLVTAHTLVFLLGSPFKTSSFLKKMQANIGGLSLAVPFPLNFCLSVSVNRSEKKLREGFDNAHWKGHIPSLHQLQCSVAACFLDLE